MKEKIYTIPVMDAFNADCECPLCNLEKELEIKEIEYALGPSMMEPDSRVESNKKGFCNRHFSLLYKQNNSLALGLIIDTHLMEINSYINSYYKKNLELPKKEKKNKYFKNIIGKKQKNAYEAEKLTDEILSYLDSLADTCLICEKLDYTMERYIEVIFYLWSKEEQFRNIFKETKGFCLKHLSLILKGAKKHLRHKDLKTFIADLLILEKAHLERIQEEVNWFTKKFDYRYNDAPWKNSKDAVYRSIEKIVAYTDLK